MADTGKGSGTQTEPQLEAASAAPSSLLVPAASTSVPSSAAQQQPLLASSASNAQQPSGNTAATGAPIQSASASASNDGQAQSTGIINDDLTPLGADGGLNKGAAASYNSVGREPPPSDPSSLLPAISKPTSTAHKSPHSKLSLEETAAMFNLSEADVEELRAMEEAAGNPDCALPCCLPGTGGFGFFNL